MVALLKAALLLLLTALRDALSTASSVHIQESPFIPEPLNLLRRQLPPLSHHEPCKRHFLNLDHLQLYTPVPDGVQLPCNLPVLLFPNRYRYPCCRSYYS